MPNYPPRTLEDHLEIADDLREAHKHLSRAYMKIAEKYRVNDKERKAISKMMAIFDYQLRHQLDNDYHKIITEREFEEHRHIYYGWRHSQP